MSETKYIEYDDCTYGLDYSDYPHVTKHTRAGKNGKDLYCLIAPVVSTYIIFHGMR